MGKIIKGVAIYTLVLIGVLILIAAFIFGLMFFIPSFTPFGWGAINISEKNTDWSENLSMKLQDGPVDYNNGNDILYGKKMYDIEIDAGEFDVQIAPNSALNGGTGQDAFLRMRTIKHVFGLVEGSKDINVITKMEMYQQVSTGEISYKFKIKVSHPTQGLITYKDSSLYIEVPTDACYNFSIRTTGGDVKIDSLAEKTVTNAGLLPDGFDAASTETDGIKINDLSIETKSGECSVSTLGKANSVKDTNGDTIQTAVQLVSLTLKTDGGKFHLSNISNLKVSDDSKLGVLLIDANKGDIEFDTVNAVVVVLGDDISITANKIDTGENPFSYRATNGFFHIGEVVTSGTQLVTIVTNNANIQIDTISSNAAMINTTYGDISIGTMNGQLKTSTTHGKINIGVAEKTLSASSTYGDIYIGTYKDNITLSNSSGSITASFLVSQANSSNLTKVKSETGSVTLKNQVNSVYLVGTESANFNVTFNKLYFGDAFEDEGPFDPANHNIIMKGSSTANISVPLAEFPIKLVLSGTTEDEKKQNKVTSNLITGVSSITKDENVAGRLSSTSASEIKIEAKEGGSVSINSYNKDQELIASTNSWFDIYAYDNSDPPRPLFPINYYYEESYRHEYSISDNESLNFKWIKKTLSDGTVVAEATTTVKIKNTLVETVPDSVTLVFKSKKYSCGNFVESGYSGGYKRDTAGNFIPLTNTDKENINKWNGMNQKQQESKEGKELKDLLPTTYVFEEKSSQLFNVTDSSIVFYVMTDFDGTADYCKVTLEMTTANQ